MPLGIKPSGRPSHRWFHRSGSTMPTEGASLLVQFFEDGGQCHALINRSQPIKPQRLTSRSRPREAKILLNVGRGHPGELFQWDEQDHHGHALRSGQLTRW